MLALAGVRGGAQPGLGVLLVFGLLEWIASGMLIPVGSFFAIEELGMKSNEIGRAMSVQAAAALFGVFALGRMSDTFGRKWPIVLSFLWGAFGRACFGLVHSYEQLLLANVVQGLGSAIPVLTDSYLLDVVKPSQRASYTGLFGASAGFAYVLGPLFGALLIHLGVPRRACFFIASSLGIVASIGSAWFLPESLPVERRRSLWAGEGQSNWSTVSAGLMLVWFLRFLGSGAEGLMYSTYALLIAENFGWSDTHFGIVLSCCGVVAALLMLFVFPLFVSTVGPGRCLAAAGLFGACAYLLYPVAKIWVHGVALMFFLCNQAFSQPVFPVLIGQFASEKHIGFANGVSTAALSLGSVFLPILGGHLYEQSPSAPYQFGAGMFACLAIGASALHAIRPTAEKEALL